MRLSPRLCRFGILATSHVLQWEKMCRRGYGDANPSAECNPGAKKQSATRLLKAAYVFVCFPLLSYEMGINE